MRLFLSFEGPDGSGKSTQVRLLCASLRGRGFAVTDTREPGGTPLGEEIRQLLLDPASPPATPLAMTFLLSAARSQLISEVIRPALAADQIVIVDRFADSTMAYQSYGLGVDPTVVRQLTEIATAGIRPDLRIYIDVPLEVGLLRVAARREWNRLDHAATEFHKRVLAGYRAMMADDPDRWVCVDGNQSAESVHCAITAALDPLLVGRVGAV